MSPKEGVDPGVKLALPKVLDAQSESCNVSPPIIIPIEKETPCVGAVKRRQHSRL
jgi:hypothetical protein